MRPGVIADLVSLGHHPLHQAHIVLGLFADHHEGRLAHPFRLRMSRILGVHVRIGPVIEAERHHSRLVPVILDGVGRGIGQHVLIGHGPVVGVHVDGARAWMRLSGDVQDVAIAVGDHIVAGRYLLERLRCGHIAGMVPDRPQRRILLAQTPQGKGLQPHLPRGAQLIQRGHRIQHPHLVAHVGVFVVVGKMRIQLIAGQAHVRIRIGRRLPSVLHRDVVGVQHLGRVVPALRPATSSSCTRSCRWRRSASLWARS